MSIRAVRRATDKIQQELIPNEHILWSASPDRPALYRRLKWFVARNLAYFLALAGIAACVVAYKPPFAQLAVAVLAIAAVARALGAGIALNKQRHLNGMAYALTDKRLISVDGRTQELSSWFNPAIDVMKTRKKGALMSFQLGDSELGFSLRLELVSDGDTLLQLLSPYTQPHVDIGPSENTDTAEPMAA